MKLMRSEGRTRGETRRAEEGKDEPRLDWVDEELISVDGEEDVVDVGHYLHRRMLSGRLDRFETQAKPDRPVSSPNSFIETGRSPPPPPRARSSNSQ